MSDNETNNLERRATGIIFYLSLLETFTKFETFKQPKKVIEILCGTLEVFLKNMLEKSPEEEQDEIKSLIIKGFNELISRLK
jgi:hypothetical protein